MELAAGRACRYCCRLNSGSRKLGANWLWAVFTVTAAFSQTVRNAMQRELTASLGTVGATHVRFLFGFPFALLFLTGVLIVVGAPLPRLPVAYWPWVIDG